MLNHIKRTTKRLGILLLVVIAISISVIRFLLPEIQQYKQHIEQEISIALNSPVRIGEIGTNMRGFQPELVLTDIVIAKTNSEPAAIKLKEIRISINFLTALGHWDLLAAGRVTLVGAELSITRKPDGSISIKGLKSGDEKPLWLLRGGEFEVLQSQVTWHDQMSQNPPRTFSDIDIAINNNYSSAQHTIHIRVNPTTEQASTLRLSLQLTGDVFSARGITGQVYVEANALDAKDFTKIGLPEDWHLTSGQGNVKLWGNWHQSRLISLAGYLGVIDLRLTRPGVQNAKVTELTTGFNWHRQGQQWRLGLSDFRFNDGQKHWPATNLSLVSYSASKAETKMGLAITRLEIGALAKLAQIFGSDENQYLASFKQVQAQGSVNDLLFYSDTEAKAWAINGVIDQIKLKPVDKIPGITNLSGIIYGSNESGYTTIASKDLRFSKPGLFRKPLIISQIQGRIDWRYIDDQWHISSDNLLLNTPVLKTQNRLQITLPENLDMSAAFIDMQSHIIDGNLPAMKTYFPVDVFGDDLSTWLDNAFVAGRLIQGDVLFYGALKDYPFSNSEGVFDAYLDAEDVELNYHPDWPHFTDVDTHVYFHNDGMTANAQDWRLNGVTIIDTYAQIVSFEHSDHLVVRAKTQGKIQHTLGFLQRTPLKSIVTSVSELIKVTGENSLNVDVQIPLIEQATAKVDGVAKLSNAKLAVLPTDLAVDKIKGNLSFNEQGVFTRNMLAAQTLGYPIKVKINQLKKVTQIKVDGRTDTSNLQDRYPGNWWSLAKGQIPYNLNVTIPADPKASSRVHLFSNLKEASLLLPGTLAKASGQTRSLTVVADLNGSSQLPIRINYADNLQAALIFDREQNNIFSGSVLFGKGDAEFQKQDVFKLQINQSKLVLDSWLGDSQSDGNSQQALLNKLSELEVNIDQLVWQNTNLKNINLQLGKSKEFWQGGFTSIYAAGRITLPSVFTPSSTVNIDMDFIDLSGLSKINTNHDQKTVDIDFQPQLIINSKKLLWQNKNLGALTLKTAAEKGGARIKKFEVKDKGHKLTLKGNWTNKKDKLRTLVKGKLEVDDLGALLTRLGISKEMRGSKSLFDFTLNWQGAPYQFNLAKVQGEIDATLQKGSLIGIEPGIGRVLGAFNLAEWKRRINLDFSDVVAAGFAYNSIEGLLFLSEGSVETNNLTIDGVSAKIEIAGRTGLVAQDFDHIVNVTPKTTAVIPIAGTIAGHVVKTITGSDPDSLTSIQYQVKGSWEQPDVTRIHDNDGALRKAWSGITGLPDWAIQKIK